MKSNEDYLDELLKSMNTGSENNSAINRLYTDAEIETELGNDLNSELDFVLNNGGILDEDIKELEPGAIEENISVDVGISEDINEDVVIQTSQADMGTGKMDQSMIDALLAGTQIAPEPNPEVVKELEDLFSIKEGMGELETLEDIDSELNSESQSVLAQLMEEMHEEAKNSNEIDFSDDDLMSESDIETLLSAAQNTDVDLYNDEVISFDITNETDMAEIEALLNMSDNDVVLDENEALLQMLENAENDITPIESTNIDDIDFSQIEKDLDIAFAENAEEAVDNSGQEDKKKEKKEKKAKKEGKGNIFTKIFSMLMEEVPEEEKSEGTEDVKLSDENKKILDELDQEEDSKIKVKEKKNSKDKNKKTKDKKSKDKKSKKEKSKKEKKPKKEKKVKVQDTYIPEKKIPRKKVIVTFIFGFSILTLILLIDLLIPPMINLSAARSAYDKGDYYEAYKGFYGEKLSEEDEVKFQASTVIMRMQSNLDGYDNHIKMNNEIMAIHSLLEGVHIKFEAFTKAEELGVLTQISEIYNRILEILNQNYHISEEDALELINEESDAVYTRKLEALAEGRTYSGGDSEGISKEDVLPQEQELFENEAE